MELITSPQNPKLRRLLALQRKSSERAAEGLFVLEGWRELGHCLSAGLRVDSVFFCPEVAGGGRSLAELDIPPGVRAYQVPPSVYGKLAYRGGTEGVMAVVYAARLGLCDLILGDNPLLVVLESVEKPGNLGAVLRSADAAGADAVVVCDPLSDLYNPNVIRSSVGSVFTVPCVACGTEECIPFLKEHHINIYTAQLQDSSLYYDADMRGGTAIVLGSEARGLTDTWRRAADRHVRIPMLGRLDSLNVSASAAVLLFEAVRQRQ